MMLMMVVMLLRIAIETRHARAHRDETGVGLSIYM